MDQSCWANPQAETPNNSLERSEDGKDGKQKFKKHLYRSKRSHQRTKQSLHLEESLCHVSACLQIIIRLTMKMLPVVYFYHLWSLALLVLLLPSPSPNSFL